MSVVVSGLTKVYGEQHAVDNLSFSLKPGEIVGFLGPNGAGKSTTMKMVTGYLQPTGGTATVAGHDAATRPLDVRRLLGYLPESNPLYYDMYVREYLRFSAGLHGIRGAAARKRVEEMIGLTGLGKEAHKTIGALSKGYKQRVGLAQALLHDPQVLILDEPTSGLDPNQILEIRELISRVGQQKTVLLSTHIMQEVQALCGRVLIISAGKLVADSSVADLRKGTATGAALLLSVEGAVEQHIFKDLKGLQRWEVAGEDRYRLHGTDANVLRRETMQWAVRHDVRVVGLQAESQSLEEVFRELTKA